MWIWGRKQDRLFRKRCEERVSSLGLQAGETSTISALCQRLGALYGRSIHLVPLSLPDGSPDGLLLSVADTDFIIFEERLAPVQQQHVILHEIGHFLCEPVLHPINPDVACLLLPSLDPRLVRRILCRSHRDTESEREAETVGSLIGRVISQWTPQTPTLIIPPEARDLVARLSALENPSRREINE